ncbi:hypothetical protein B0F86_04535 [Pseudomonas syringae]|nr:hypothetical protein B0F86_04535 [Pseudomonas syringae]
MRLSFLTLQRGNALGDAPRHRFASLRTFRIGRRASRTACDAERRTIVKTVQLSGCSPRSVGTIVTELSFLTLQRGNAVRDAPRHRFASLRTFRIGRGASRTACDAERRTIVGVIVLHAHQVKTVLTALHSVLPSARAGPGYGRPSSAPCRTTESCAGTPGHPSAGPARRCSASGAGLAMAR